MTAVAAAEVERRRRDLILKPAFMLFGRGPLDWIAFTNALCHEIPSRLDFLAYTCTTFE